MHTHTRKLTVAGLAFAALALAACDRSPEAPVSSGNESPSVGAQVDSAVDRTKEMVGDAGITAKVKSKLIVDSELKAAQIDVDTSNGAVTLRGSVASTLEKDRATNLAREVEGVSSVDNQLIVGRSS